MKLKKGDIIEHKYSGHTYEIVRVQETYYKFKLDSTIYTLDNGNKLSDKLPSFKTYIKKDGEK